MYSIIHPRQGIRVSEQKVLDGNKNETKKVKHLNILYKPTKEIQKIYCIHNGPIQILPLTPPPCFEGVRGRGKG